MARAKKKLHTRKAEFTVSASVSSGGEPQRTANVAEILRGAGDQRLDSTNALMHHMHVDCSAEGPNVLRKVRDRHPPLQGCLRHIRARVSHARAEANPGRRKLKCGEFI